jgi:hypothetical protein
MNFAILRSILGWDSLEAVRLIHSVLEFAAILFFILLVVFEVLAHKEEEEIREKLLERIGLWFFGIAVFMELVAFIYGQRNDTLSGAVITSLDAKANDASSKAAKAVGDSGIALGQAKDAETKSSDAITSAGDATILARGARSDVASAQQQEEELRAELERLRTPRSLSDVSQLISALAPYQGTKYLYEAVGTTPEALDLLRAIDSALQQAGWVRDETPFVVIGLHPFADDPKFGVPVSFVTGVHVGITLPNTEDKATLNLLWPSQSPEAIKKASFLLSHLRLHIVPSTAHAFGNEINVSKGPVSNTVRITVGDKPIE